MAEKKTWIEKRDIQKIPKVKRTDKDFADIPAGSTMLIATPQLVDAYVKTIPEGRSLDIKTIRKDLALEYGADYTCPVTTGIFLRIVAESAHEELQNGGNLETITPFWRVVDPKSTLAKKLTFGKELLMEMREKEGI
ncbi:MAG: hypothetical protein EA341_12865 [Mongoliibacter sp.]|uniref:hypothetical protein n=1 Tax=Mongoliibacter sp. TaxID=2022438 RepID=UPI0012EF6610|nr:hypothetical protein [Mongoliibacter sp.]TVP47366.1 MAG: hypothetical protein EA341_12865 [Mongoliibacter sp.]